MVYEQSIEGIEVELEKVEIRERINEILKGAFLVDPVSYITEALSLLRHQ